MFVESTSICKIPSLILRTGQDSSNVVFYSRLYVHFVDAPASDIGYNNTTFHEIFGGR